MTNPEIEPLDPYRPPWVGTVVFALIGAFFLLGGLYLIYLHGSFYYAIAGVAYLTVARYLFKRDAACVFLFGILVLGTLLWSVGEVNFTLWELEPRLVMPVVLAFYLLIRARHFTRSPADGPDSEQLRMRTDSARRAGFALLGVASALSVLAMVVATRNPVGIAVRSEPHVVDPPVADALVSDGDWRFYGRTAEGDRFTPLLQITPNNIKDLTLAWQARTNDLMRTGEDKGATVDAGREFNFEATPIKVNDRLYLCTPHSQVLALDPGDGHTLWHFDPNPDTTADVYVTCRGVSYYEAPPNTVTDCPRRIIAPVMDARLVALNAETGKPCEDFGTHGFISLTQYLGNVPPGFHFVTSPPLVVHDRVILGGWIRDNQAENEPSGAVRAFDPRTGALAWAWDIGVPGQVAHPRPNDELTRATPNAWGVFTADLTQNLVYLPTGNATPDYYGAHRRPMDEKYSSSVVALDIDSGAPRWTFQTVHHDLWDMDVPIGPSLVTLDTPEGPVPALVQSTKRGELFVLDRRTGAPIFPVTEQPVPQDAVAGDTASPTQPFSSGMPSLAPPPLTETHLWGATALDQLLCRIEFKRSHYEGQFTPPSLESTIVYPAFDGIIDWQGVSVDPTRKLVIANSSYMPFKVQFTPRDEALAKGMIKPWSGSGPVPEAAPGVSPQYGTPYVARVVPWLNLLQVPCNPPPWGTLTAISLRSQKILWQRPLGTTRDSGPFGSHYNLPLETGIFNIGGNITTVSGIIFIGATADDYLRALSTETGEELWRARLPAGGQATPMSYMYKGRQYVVIAAGGHGGLGTRAGDYVMAYALPR